MRIFLHEYTCGGGLGGTPVSAALHAEGWAMLAAVLHDFQRLPGVETVTLLDERLSAPPAGTLVRRVRAGEEEGAFRALAGAADYTLVIAPEFDQLLLERCRWVEEVGGRLLGPTLEAIALTGDKLALGRHLRQCGVPTPGCYPCMPNAPLPPLAFPAVWKPRHGAGSVATFLVRQAGELPLCRDQVCAEGWTGEALLQPFVPGQPASVALLTGPGPAIALLPAAQNLSAEGRFHYQGGTLPLPPALAARAVPLAQQAAAAVSGLGGYVGVDLVLGAADDGSGDAVIEINPRLTTSYVGLRALAETNLAGALLAAATGQEVGTVRWRSGTVRFQADGEVFWTRGEERAVKR